MIIKHDPDTIFPYLTDASNFAGGFAEQVIIPETQEELIEAVRTAYTNNTPITISGGGTGLSGGRVPYGGMIISTERLRTLTIDREKHTATVEAGLSLRELQEEVEREGLLYAPDPTERTASMGGTVSANASGARTFKYGATREFVVGLKIVLANGETLTLKRGECKANGYTLVCASDQGTCYTLALPSIIMPTRKHAAGFFVKENMDAIDLFVGSEGVLGIIAEMTVRLLPKPERIIAGVVFFDTIENCLSFVATARDRSYANRIALEQSKTASGFDARALEFFDEKALDFVRDQYPNIPTPSAGAVWFEQEVTDDNEQVILEEWYELIAPNTPYVDEAWFAITESDQESLREFRHAVPSKAYERIRELGQQKIGTDMAVPDEHFLTLYHYYLQEFQEQKFDYVIWGHIGNSHVHANIFTQSPEEYTRAKECYARCIDKTIELRGTVSAEHGVGKIKAGYLQRMYGAETIEAFRTIKQTFDPAMLLGRETMFTVTAS
jgi:D-lactate dehydrogenase (cytochrome)